MKKKLKDLADGHEFILDSIHYIIIEHNKSSKVLVQSYKNGIINHLSEETEVIPIINTINYYNIHPSRRAEDGTIMPIYSD